MLDRTATHAATLRNLHERSGLVVVPNVWDVASARLFAEIPGVSTLATTSAGIAASFGYPDGESLDRDRMLEVVARINAAVDLPVSADLESGYGTTTATVEAALEAGCAGVNLEDGTSNDADSLTDPDEHASRIATARAVAERRGVPLVINARTDVYWRRFGRPAERFEESITRLRRYARSGADCLFLPGFPTPETTTPERDVRDLVRELDGMPVNLLVTPSTPPVDVLAGAGVRRLTVGSALYRLAMSSAHRATAALLDTGRPDALSAADDLPYAQLARTLQDTR